MLFAYARKNTKNIKTNARFFFEAIIIDHRPAASSSYGDERIAASAIA
jgi:hypothetical protein